MMDWTLKNKHQKELSVPSTDMYNIVVEITKQWQKWNKADMNRKVQSLSKSEE